MNNLCKFTFIIISTIIATSKWTFAFDDDLNRCSPELVKGECSEYYNYTISSFDDNIFHSNVDALMHLYDELLNIPCSNYLKLFLCTKYKPPCLKTKSNNFIIANACQNMCEHIYEMCYPYMELRNNQWPSDLNCKSFPSKEITSMCIDHDGFPKDVGLKFSSVYFSNNISNSKYVCFNRTDSISKNNYICVLRCELDISQSHEIAKKFICLLITITSSICLCLCFYIFFIFKKFKKSFLPSELCLIFVTFSYFIYSFVHLVALQVDSRSISCQNILIQQQEQSAIQQTQKSVSVSLTQINDNIYALIIFMILNYSRISILFWWLVTSFYLFSINFPYFRIDKLRSKIIYGFTWFLPAIHTIVAKDFADISEITGLFSIDNNNSNAFLMLNILPNFLIIFIGNVFLFLSFYKNSIDRKRYCESNIFKRFPLKENIKSVQDIYTKETELTIICFIFIIPVIISTCCEVNEYFSMNLWLHFNRLIEFKDPYNYYSNKSSLSQTLSSTSSRISNYKFSNKDEYIDNINNN